MRTRSSHSIIVVALIALSTFLGLAGCATTSTPTDTARTLLAAGFKLRTPETARQKQIFASLPSYQVHRLTVKGQNFYVYKDESKGMALVGHEAEFQRYQQMARQDNLSESHTRATQMDDVSAMNWSSDYFYGGDWR